MKFNFTLLALLALSGPRPAVAQEITVAAAADLTFAFQDVAARFQKETGKPVKLAFGSSGNFYSQLRNGAPFDLFFSADMNYAQKLEAQGLTVPGSLYPYAVGRIVLWAPEGSAIDVSRGLRVLSSPSVRTIAIANPEHAPYGRAAAEALKREGVYEAVKDKLVLGENISQTAQFVESGNADVGILALSLALAPTMKGKGRYFEIKASSYTTLKQAAVIMKSSREKSLAAQFLEFLKKPETVNLLRSYGFTTPGQNK